MKVLKNLSFLFLLSALVLTSCNREDMDKDPTKIQEILVTASLSGEVIDETGLPIENVLVNIGTNSTETDVNGVFKFTNVQMNKNGARVLLEKNGYFSNTKVIMTKANTTAITKVMLIEKKITSTFQSANGGSATTNGGAKVLFPENAIKLESGGAYTGNVNIYATWLDPTASDLSLRMPGDLRATNADDEDVKLVTYGMIGVEMEGENGESLNLADGETASIEIPVPSALMNSAPATIPLWHFDEATGFWIEEGEATLSGNTYIGSVSHFSFWNFDVPYDLVQIEGIVTDEKPLPIAGLDIQISVDNSGDAAYGYTDENGVYEGFVPKDQALTITIYDKCGEIAYTGQIGPFSEDTVIPTIEITNSNGNFLTVFGVLNNCDNEAESNGYVKVEVGYFSNDYIDVDGNGNFSGTISLCDQMEVTVSGVSLDPFSQGTTTIHDINGIQELNVGTLVTCW